MSHLIEEYAKSLGVKVGLPNLSSHYFPIQYDRYITIQTTNKFQSRDYSHWNKVSFFLKKHLQDIRIIQVGEQDNPLVSGIDLDLRGKTTIKQLSYVIEKSLLHVGIDSLCVHLASAHDIPCVGLYSNMWPSNSGPVWHQKSKFICINSEKNGNKASYAIEEDPKTIDSIKPEAIASSALNLLNIKNKLYQYETLHIGTYYHSQILEVVPDFKPDADFYPNRLINLRCDYSFDEDNLKYWLHRKVNLMANKEINLNLLYYFRKNIAGSTIFIENDDISPEYIKELNSFGIKNNLICKDKNKLNDFRFKFFDFVVNEYLVNTKKDLDFCDKLCDDSYYHSNKIIVSKNKSYSSKSAWKVGLEKSDDPQHVIDDKDFWEEIDYLNIYNHDKNKKHRRARTQQSR